MGDSANHLNDSGFNDRSDKDASDSSSDRYDLTPGKLTAAESGKNNEPELPDGPSSLKRCKRKANDETIDEGDLNGLPTAGLPASLAPSQKTLTIRIAKPETNGIKATVTTPTISDQSQEPSEPKKLELKEHENLEPGLDFQKSHSPAEKREPQQSAQELDELTPGEELFELPKNTPENAAPATICSVKARMEQSDEAPAYLSSLASQKLPQSQALKHATESHGISANNIEKESPQYKLASTESTPPNYHIYYESLRDDDRVHDKYHNNISNRQPNYQQSTERLNPSMLTDLLEQPYSYGRVPRAQCNLTRAHGNTSQTNGAYNPSRTLNRSYY